MSSRTYVPSLRTLATGLNRYATHWQAQIEDNLTPEQLIAFTEFIACLANLLSKLGAEPVDP